MDIFKVQEIFTPTKPARENFITRDKIDKRVVRGLRTTGTQVILYGHTGSGKTTLLLNKLAVEKYEYVKTNCTSSMSFESLLANVYRQLNKAFISKEVISNGQSGGLKFGIPKILEGNTSTSDGHTTEITHFSDLDAIELSLAQAIGELGYCWVIEDFHKLEQQVKKKLAQLMKVFMDLSDDYPKLKIIALGAKNTAREVVELDDEMQRRVAEIYVPLMLDSEIKEIVINGGKLLNITITKSTIEDVIKHSHGVASICHQLSALMCEFADIDNTADSGTDIELHYDHFNYAVSEYIEQESDSLKSAFQKAFKITGAYKVITCLSENLTDGICFDEIFVFINENFDDIELDEAALSNVLQELNNIENGFILLYDDNSETYSFRDPFYKIFAGIFLREKGTVKKPNMKQLEDIFNKALINLKGKYSSPESTIGGDSDSVARQTSWANEVDSVDNKFKKEKSKLKNYRKHSDKID